MGCVYEFNAATRACSSTWGFPHRRGCAPLAVHRYKGTSPALARQVKAIEVLDASRLRFVLHAPARLPDLLRDPATGAALDCPKQYLEQVGEEGFQRHPIGLGPIASCAGPGVELVLEANTAIGADPVDPAATSKGARAPHRPWPCSDGEADLATFMVGDEGAGCNATRSCGWGWSLRP